MNSLTGFLSGRGPSAPLISIKSIRITWPQLASVYSKVNMMRVFEMYFGTNWVSFEKKRGFIYFVLQVQCIWFIWYVCIALVHTLKVHKESDILDCVRLHHEDKLHIVKMSNPRQGVKKTVTVQSIVKNLKIRYGLLSW